MAPEEVGFASLTSVDSFGGAESFLGLRPGFGLAGMTHSFDAAGAWVQRGMGEKVRGKRWMGVYVPVAQRVEEEATADWVESLAMGSMDDRDDGGRRTRRLYVLAAADGRKVQARAVCVEGV